MSEAPGRSCPLAYRYGAAALSINQRVLAHHAIAGNVEFELCSAMMDAGCGCAYPENVDQSLVERANRIHAHLQLTAQKFPEILASLSSLPLFARFSVGEAQIGVVHGDANSLSGWLFDAVALDVDANRDTIIQAFSAANVSVVANNGAARIPNFQGQHTGLLTRVSVYPSPHVSAYGMKRGDVHVDAIAICYDDDMR